MCGGVGGRGVVEGTVMVIMVAGGGGRGAGMLRRHVHAAGVTDPRAAVSRRTPDQDVWCSVECRDSKAATTTQP